MQRFASQDPYLQSGYRAMNIIIEEDASCGRGALWLGDYTAAQDRVTLKAKGIKSVLTVAQGLNISYPKGSEIIHKTYNIQDIESANISKIWNDTYQRIEDGLQKGGVLVHCAAGVSRSASTVIAFIMRKRGLSFIETINFVRSKRPVIFPNQGFQRQLKSFEREIKYERQNVQPQQAVNSPIKEKTNLTYLDQIQSMMVDNQTPNKALSYNLIQFSPMKVNNPFAQKLLQTSLKSKLLAQSPIIKQTKTKQVEFGKGKHFMQGLGSLPQKQQKLSENQLILSQISNLNKSQQNQQHQSLQISKHKLNNRSLSAYAKMIFSDDNYLNQFLILQFISVGRAYLLYIVFFKLHQYNNSRYYSIDL